MVVIYHQLDIVDKLDECDGYAMSPAFALLLFFSATPRLLLEPRGIGSISITVELQTGPKGTLIISDAGQIISLRSDFVDLRTVQQLNVNPSKEHTRVYGRFFSFFFPGYG